MRPYGFEFCRVDPSVARATSVSNAWLGGPSVSHSAAFDGSLGRVRLRCRQCRHHHRQDEPGGEPLGMANHQRRARRGRADCKIHSGRQREGGPPRSRPHSG